MDLDFSVEVEAGEIYLTVVDHHGDDVVNHLEIRDAEELIEMLRMAINAARLYDIPSGN